MPPAYTQRGPPVDSNSLHITQAVNTEHEMWAQSQNATVGLTENFLANNTYGIRIHAAEIKPFKDGAQRADIQRLQLSFTKRQGLSPATCSVQKRENFTIFSIYSITKY